MKNVTITLPEEQHTHLVSLLSGMKVTTDVQGMQMFISMLNNIKEAAQEEK